MPYQKVEIGSQDINAVELKIGGLLGLSGADPQARPSLDDLRFLKKRMVVLEESDKFGLPLIDTATGIRTSTFVLLVGPEGTARNDRHKYIPDAHGYSESAIRGGGYCTFDMGTVRLEGYSEDFGTVPTDLRRRFGMLLSKYFQDTMDLKIAPEELFLNAEQMRNFDGYTKPYWLRFKQVFKTADARFHSDMLRLVPQYNQAEERMEKQINDVYFRSDR